MTEDEAWTAVEDYLAAINDERRYIDPLYKPLKAVVRAFQKAPRIKGAYALVTSLGMVDNHEADHFCYGEAVILSRSQKATNPDMQSRAVVTEARTRSYLYKFRVDVFASNALDYANVLRSAFLSSRATVDLAGMMPRTVGNVDFNPQFVAEDWEGRAKFEVELAGLHAISNAIDVIESGHVGMTGTGSQTIKTEFTYEKE